MNTYRVLASLLLMFSSLAVSQEISQPLAAEAVVANCGLAMGSAALPSQVTLDGMLRRAERPDAAFTIKVKGKAYRRDLRREDGDLTLVISKGLGHRIERGEKRAVSAHLASHFDPDILPAASCSLQVLENMDVTLVGLEDGLYHLRIRAKVDPKKSWISGLLSEKHIYIDSQNFRLVKSWRYIFDPEAIQNRSKYETRYSNFRIVNGMLLAGTVTHSIDHNQIEQLEITNLSDADVSDADFK